MRLAMSRLHTVFAAISLLALKLTLSALTETRVALADHERAFAALAWSIRRSGVLSMLIVIWGRRAGCIGGNLPVDGFRCSHRAARAGQGAVKAARASG